MDDVTLEPGEEARPAPEAETVERPRILVAFATKHGSTPEVAEAVAEELRDGGADVDVRPASLDGNLSGYQAVVLGAPMILGWHKDALRFIDTATQKKGEELMFPGSSSVSLAFTSDGAHAVAAGGTTVYALDGISGKVRARHVDFKRAEGVLVEETSRKEERRQTYEPETQAPDVVVEPR